MHDGLWFVITIPQMMIEHLLLGNLLLRHLCLVNHCLLSDLSGLWLNLGSELY